eukprot:1136806-Pelagomonas_calceolata.AAC.4
MGGSTMRCTSLVLRLQGVPKLTMNSEAPHRAGAQDLSLGTCPMAHGACVVQPHGDVWMHRGPQGQSRAAASTSIIVTGHASTRIALEGSQEGETAAARQLWASPASPRSVSHRLCVYVCVSPGIHTSVQLQPLACMGVHPQTPMRSCS